VTKKKGKRVHVWPLKKVLLVCQEGSVCPPKEKRRRDLKLRRSSQKSCPFFGGGEGRVCRIGKKGGLKGSTRQRGEGNIKAFPTRREGRGLLGVFLICAPKKKRIAVASPRGKKGIP